MLAALGADEGALADRRGREGAAATGVGGLRERRPRAFDRARRHPQRELAAPGRRDDPGGARDSRAAGLERRGAAHRDRRRLRGRVPARARARSRSRSTPAGFHPTAIVGPFAAAAATGEAARPPVGRARARVRHRRQPGRGPARVLLRRRLDEALPPRLGLAQRLPRRASRAGRIHRAVAGVRRARRRALGLRRRGPPRAR